ncbi:hypothetical protein [Sphingobium sp. TCM1]|uniref:hypothetical protein n=1 Tax=Sphingobium sp. TCM1 TaxID=453246 RepID=UPI0007F3B659|nr:hypothetical protein [Sphingobium sp. TCM1]OAN54815.1 hypothetical protein A7Q26_22970 [Sphingobium sp. TCM1]
MKRLLLLGSTALLLGADLPPPARPSLPAARLPGFAAQLAQQPAITDGAGWRIVQQDGAWRSLATARAADRQQVRWDYARSLIGQERGAEALGVLDVMRQDDPDLAMVDAWRLARGAALIQLGRFEDASTMLSGATLADNAEACLWRMRALALDGLAEQALGQMRCAAPALAGPRRKLFALAAARAAVEAGRPADALRWLMGVPDRDPAANLYRGRAELALGRPDQARLRFARVEQSGGMALRMDARLSEIEAEVANGALDHTGALKRLAALRYAWRGDAIEERALRLSYRLSADRGDLRGALSAGATLFRYFDGAKQGADFLPGLQAKLADALDPARKLPLEQAAGLYWDYRDLSPSGAGGDLLVSRLAERLQAAGIYGRAADLLDYQLFHRAGDLARGPLSARVAGLHILAGRPDRALDLLKRSADPSFPDAMVHARKRVEAVALARIGRVPEALAVLQDVPGASALRAEILWQQRDWRGLADETADALPGAGSFGDIDQTLVLRHAIALAMLGREDALTTLRSRYRASFVGLRTAAVFDLLTGAPGSADGDTLARAMAAMPGASPAGDMATLLDHAPGKG